MFFLFLIKIRLGKNKCQNVKDVIWNLFGGLCISRVKFENCVNTIAFGHAIKPHGSSGFKSIVCVDHKRDLTNFVVTDS